MVDKEEVLREVYALFNVRSLDLILERMDKDVDWPNGMEGGRVHGHEGIREYWTRQWKMIDPHVQPVGFATDEGGDTVVTVHQVVRDLEGKVLMDQQVLHVYTFRDGLIERMEIR